MSALFCPKCGNPQLATDRFCQRCGVNLAEAIRAAGAVPSRAATPSAESPLAKAGPAPPVSPAEKSAVQGAAPAHQLSISAPSAPPAIRSPQPEPAVAPSGAALPSGLRSRSIWIASGIVGTVVLAILVVTVAVLFGSGASPASRPQEEIATSAGILTDEEQYRLLALAAEYTNPRARAAFIEISPSALTKAPDQFAGQTVVVEGQLSRRVAVYSIGRADWTRAYALVVTGDGEEILVLYRGYVGHIALGDRVRVAGLYAAAANGIHADTVVRLAAQGAGFPPGIWFSTAVIAGNVAWAVLCVAFFLWRARRWHAYRSRLRALRNRSRARPPMGATLLFFLFAFGAAGCTVEVSTVIEPDGSGTVSLFVSENRENMDFLRQVPGLADYIPAWQASLRADGMLVANTRVGDTESFFLHSRFGSVSDLAQTPAGAETLDTWVTAIVLAEGTTRLYRYLALVDTTTLYRESPETDPAAAAEARDELDRTVIRYAVSLPGEIVYQNASEARRNRLVWNIRMNDRNEIVAESRLAAPKPEDNSTVLWQISAVIFLVFGLLMALAWLDYRVPRITESNVSG